LITTAEQTKRLMRAAKAPALLQSLAEVSAIVSIPGLKTVAIENCQTITREFGLASLFRSCRFPNIEIHSPKKMQVDEDGDGEHCGGDKAAAREENQVGGGDICVCIFFAAIGRNTGSKEGRGERRGEGMRGGWRGCTRTVAMVFRSQCNASSTMRSWDPSSCG